MNHLRKTLTSLTLALAASGLVTLPLAARQSAGGKGKPAAEAKAHGRRSNHAAPFTGTLNLNTATAEQLAQLPHVGPKVAQRIVEFRQKNGAFKRVEELMSVKGIGEKTFVKIKGNLTI